MPSNFTENYQLSQWEADDRVLRTDFNADNAKIDAALGALTTLVGTPLRAAWGSYTGTGGLTNTIKMGLRPVFVRMFRKDASAHQFVLQGDQAEFMGNEVNSATWKANNDYNTYKVIVQDDGLFLSPPSNASGDSYKADIICNAKNGKYVWFAIGM